MFITFEGIGGAGKTTQTALLSAWLSEGVSEVLLTREPGGTELGERLRTVLLDGGEISLSAEAALFAAARAELAQKVIAPALSRGAHVVCDRYVDSSLAYQGIAKGLGIDVILDMNLALTGGLLPDKTFLLLVEVDEAQRRRQKTDRIEHGEQAFLKGVDDAYRHLAELFSERIILVDGMDPPDEIAARIREELAARV